MLTSAYDELRLALSFLPRLCSQLFVVRSVFESEELARKESSYSDLSAKISFFVVIAFLFLYLC